MAAALAGLYGQISQAAVNRSEAMLDRFMGLGGTDFETPWGKGPYWNTKTLPTLTRLNLQATVGGAKLAGIHPLAALGQAPGGGGGGGGMPGRPAPGARGVSGGAPNMGREMSAAQIASIGASRQKDEAMASYYNALAAKTKQAMLIGGAPLQIEPQTMYRTGPGAETGYTTPLGNFSTEGYTPAEQYQQYFGEPGEWVGGALNMAGEVGAKTRRYIQRGSKRISRRYLRPDYPHKRRY